ncbi:MAG: hypothetical protein HZB34_06350 [Nitrospirae bacterium]|nr:hypothetical protein [Nitrospirota bacterium]
MSETILKDVGKIIDEALGLRSCGIGKEPHYKHKATCQKLSEFPPPTFDATALIGKIYAQVICNWKKGVNYEPSTENWRFESRTNIDARNDDPEIKLERAIVSTQTQLPMNWANQTPTSSGFVGPRADKHRNIDLIHRGEDGAYEFIELKVGSDTPLYAAMEILQNAVLYIFTRENEQKIEGGSDEQKPLRGVTVIHLKVLAPCSYYEGYNLAWLEVNICNGLKAFLVGRTSKLQMDFRFDAFPPWFTSGHAKAICKDLSKEQADSIRMAVDNRSPVYSR